jgi:hypothetical protein
MVVCDRIIKQIDVTKATTLIAKETKIILAAVGTSTLQVQSLS